MGKLAQRLREVMSGGYNLSILHTDFGIAVKAASAIVSKLDTRLSGYHFAGYREGSLSPEAQLVHQHFVDLQKQFAELDTEVSAAALLADADLARYAAEQATAALKRATESAGAADEAAEYVQEAAGITGTAELAAGFDAFAEQEQSRTTKLRWAAIGFAAAAVGVVI